ncbi:MAG: cation:proton antiporter [Methanomassiliicoccales archaeon]
MLTISDTELYAQFGIIMMAALVGAAIASRLKQSMILGYIAAGALIGPYVSITLFGFHYTGFVASTELLSYFAKMGLVLLLFFVGLEFSMSKLRKTRTAATILAVFNFGVDMFLGILLGVLLRWPLEESFFLAAIIATGSSAVAAKTLMEIGRLTAPETDFIIGMSVVEDFIAMLLLTIAGGIVLTHSSRTDVISLISAIGSFYLIFILLALFVIPRVIGKLNMIRNDELFILFALGIVFLSAALAQALYVQSLIGSFFIGMVFAETRMTERLKTKLMSMRDAFVAIFFVYFGMLINPSVLLSILPVVAFAVPLMIFSDVFLTSAIAVLIGFPSRHAFFVGATSAFRGAESMLFATVGGSSMGPKYASQLYAIAAPFALVMDVIAIPLLKNSTRLVTAIGRNLPSSIRFSSLLISRTFSKLVMPQSLRIYGDARRSTLPLWLFILSASISIFMDYPFRILLLSVSLICALMSLRVLRRDLSSTVHLVNYTNLGVNGSTAAGHILELIMSLVAATMLTTIAVISIAPFYFAATLLPVSACGLFVILRMHRAYIRLGRPRPPVFTRSLSPQIPFKSTPVEGVIVPATRSKTAYLRPLTSRHEAEISARRRK